MDFESKKRLRRERARLKHLEQAGLLKEGGQETIKGEENRKDEPKKSRKKEHVFLPRIKEIYEKDYKKLLWITIILILLSMAQIGYQIATTGDFLNKGVSLKGGIAVTIPSTDYDVQLLEKQLRENFGGYDIGVRKITSAGAQSGISIEVDMKEDSEIDKFMEFLRKTLSITKDDYSFEVIGSSLGASFFRETIFAIVAAFVFMAIAVFLYFRVPIPSLLVVLAAFSDIISTIAVVNLTGMKISTAGIAAYLMLIGYSVDTDMLLTTRVLRRKEGTIMDGIYSAIKTGLTMTITTGAAVLVGMIFSKSGTLKQIMIILFIGLIFDVFYTWIQNAAALRWYLEKNPDKGEIRQNA